MCTVERGSVEMLRNDALTHKNSMTAALACRPVPSSEQLRVCFPE